MDDDDRRTWFAGVVFLHSQIEKPIFDGALTIAQVMKYDNVIGSDIVLGRHCIRATDGAKRNNR
jgi:hypothetical protein